MATPKGVSGNPKGRPPKNRALTEILEKAGAASLEIDGKKVSSKRLLATLLWEAATTGKVTFAPDMVLTCNLDQWVGIAKLIYMQVDGAPKQDVSLNDGEPLRHIIEVEIGRTRNTPQDSTQHDHPSADGVLGE